jgi:hypothetical protein
MMANRASSRSISPKNPAKAIKVKTPAHPHPGIGPRLSGKIVESRTRNRRHTPSLPALDPHFHGDDSSVELQTEAQSAEARPTGRRTKCAPAERSRQAAGVSGMSLGTKCRGKADRPSHEVRPSGAQPSGCWRERYEPWHKVPMRYLMARLCEIRTDQRNAALTISLHIGRA